MNESANRTLKITVITAFPEFLDSFLHTSIVGRAVKNGLIQVNTVDLRDFSRGNYHQIDDYSFGGKGGMTIMPQVLKDALNFVIGDNLSNAPEEKANENGKNGAAKVLFPTPVGSVLTQDLVETLLKEEHLVIFCGHYEGLDERFVEKYVDLEYSIGDYVLTGGEIPAMTLIDAVSRLIPGVVGKELSVTDDSFYNGMLDTPHYTRPAVWQGQEVPAVLTGGNDAQIEKWRKRTAAIRTLQRRPDLLSRANVMDYLDDEVYLGLCVNCSGCDNPDNPKAKSLASELEAIQQIARAYNVERLIVAPTQRQDFETLRQALFNRENERECARENRERPEQNLQNGTQTDPQKESTIKCVPTVSRMTEWAQRKKHGPLLTIAAEISGGVPWMEVKRQTVEHDGPVLILFGAAPSHGRVTAMRPQETTGGDLPRIALVSATLDRFFGSR